MSDDACEVGAVDPAGIGVDALAAMPTIESDPRAATGAATAATIAANAAFTAGLATGAWADPIRWFVSVHYRPTPDPRSDSGQGSSESSGAVSDLKTRQGQ